MHSHTTIPMRGRLLVTAPTLRRTLLSLSAASALLAGCSTSEPDAAASTPAAGAANAGAPAARAVTLAPQDVATATLADVTTGVLLTGTLEPAERATVTAQVGGTLGPISVDRGSAVRRGQRLATIEAQGVRSQAAGARASVAAAEAQLAVARTQRDAARRLFEAGASSRVDAQNAQAAYAAAEAQVAAARAQATAAGEVAGFTTVVAPISGVVSDRPAEPGEAVRAGDPIVTIVNTSVLELAGRVPVDEAGAIRVGQAVTFALDAFPGRQFKGTVARKDPAADPSSRQVGVYVRLANSNGEITAGQYARGQVSGRRVEDAVTVPVTAVQGTGAEAAVFVVQGYRLARRPVTLGARDEAAGTVAVTTGLRAGERVLARPTPTVADGQPVIIGGDQRPSAPAAAQSAAPAREEQ
jgi:RND family efflux transporter MFP subunit